MPLPTESGAAIAFTTATCVQAWTEYPFNKTGDSVTKVYRHMMQVKRANYAPLAFDDEMTAAGEKPARSPFADDALAFWVGDSQPSQIGGDLVEFERTFANIPVSRTEGYGLYPVEAPGVAANTSVVIATSESTPTPAISVIGDWDVTVIFTVGTGVGASFTEGLLVDINNDAVGDGRFTGTFTILVYNQGSYDEVVVAKNFNMEASPGTDITGDVITCTKDISVNFPSNYTKVESPTSSETITTFTASNDLIARDPETLNTTANVQFDYFKVDSIFEITVNNKFHVITSAGDKTDTSSATTNPTSEEYLELIAAGSTLNAEDSSLNRWMGNIWSRETIRGKAQ